MMGTRQRKSEIPERRQTNKVRPTPAQLPARRHFPGRSMREKGKEMGRRRWGAKDWTSRKWLEFARH